MGSFYRRRGKRIFDVVGATGALVISSPIQLVIAVIVRKQMGVPILFSQNRPGLNCHPFTLVKFRTMDPSNATSSSVNSDADRLTPVGRFLRSASLDELPEFWNVLRGDMSLVGPRPLLTDYLERYSAEQNRRHHLRPGVTGWAQVNGRNVLGWDEKFTLDVWYVDHFTFKLDVQILWKTAKAVVKRSGISAQGHETMPEFNPTKPRNNLT
jgi:lipopolysaccharide/colanic/teichoic acid biosynthesis glycosyltransferase